MAISGSLSNKQKLDIVIQRNTFFFKSDDFEEKVHYGGEEVDMRAKNRFGRKRIEDYHPLGANPGDVLEINTQPNGYAHSASFPERLCELPIKTSCPRWICEKCGKIREQIIERESIPTREVKDKEYKTRDPGRNISQIKSIKWSDCGCNAGYKSGVCLDPFFGTGTVGVVANKLGRDYIGFELNPKYIEIARKRVGEEEQQLKMAV